MQSHGIKGKIINLTSKAGERIGFDPYTLSKWGANSITRGNARRLAPYHINVNGIAPGRGPTNITAELQSHKNSDNVIQRTMQPKDLQCLKRLRKQPCFWLVGLLIILLGRLS